MRPNGQGNIRIATENLMAIISATVRGSNGFKYEYLYGYSLQAHLCWKESGLDVNILQEVVNGITI